MTLGPRWIGWLVVGLILAGLVLAGVIGSCERDRDVPGQRADSVLASDTIYRLRIQEQDAVIAHLEDSIRATDAARRRWRDSARTLTRQADTAQAAIDATVAAGVPPGTEPATFWRDQFQAQARVAATLRLQVIPALERTIAADSVGIGQRDEYGAAMRDQRDFARERAREITAEFRRYREATKPGIDLGLFRVPDEVVKVAAGGVIFYAGCKVGGGC